MASSAGASPGSTTQNSNKSGNVSEQTSVAAASTASTVQDTVEKGVNYVQQSVFGQQSSESQQPESPHVNDPLSEKVEKDLGKPQLEEYIRARYKSDVYNPDNPDEDA